MKQEHKNLFSAVISAQSILEYQRLTDEERTAFREKMDDYIKEMDNLGITFRFQNAIFAAGWKNDVRKHYLSTLIDGAIHECGGEQNIFRKAA
jgi:hypothetical protein